MQFYSKQAASTELGPVFHIKTDNQETFYLLGSESFSTLFELLDFYQGLALNPLNEKTQKWVPIPPKVLKYA